MFVRFYLLLFCLTTLEGFSQRKAPFISYSAFSIGGGGSVYGGDLIATPYKDPLGMLKMTTWNAGANYTKYISPKLGLRASFNWIRLMGDDYTFTVNNLSKPGYDGRFIRNLHFRNDLKEFTISGILNFTSSGRSSQQRSHFQPYGIAGFGFFAHNPQARTKTNEITRKKGAWVSLAQSATEAQGLSGYPKLYYLVQPVIPIGLGFRIKLNKKVDVNLEGLFHTTFTDYIDDVSSGPYPNPTDLKDDLAKELSDRSKEQYAARTGKDRTQALIDILTARGISGVNDPFDFDLSGYDVPTSIRGSNKYKDMYATVRISFSYLIDPKIKCPPIK